MVVAGKHPSPQFILRYFLIQCSVWGKYKVVYNNLKIPYRWLKTRFNNFARIQ